MKPLKPQHFDEALGHYRHCDPELHAELKRKLSRSLDETVAETKSWMNIAEGKALVTDEGEATASGRLLTETIVKPNARPVMLIRDNQATTGFLGPESQVWAGRIDAAKPLLDQVIPSVGRVEVINNPDFSWLGTGWLVADDVIVTNRHVASEFGRLGPAGFIFRMGANGGLQSSRIDFLEEDQRTSTFDFDVESIIWIAPAAESDVAFLRVRQTSGGRPLPPKIPLAETVTPDEFVATIGYPARDPRVPDQDLVRRIFGDVYEKKRLAPGQVTTVEQNEIQHDCSTLGGNSGSAVISLKSGAAVGLHFSGLFLQANFAVSASKVRTLLRRMQLGELTGLPTRIAAPVAPTNLQTPIQTAAGAYTLRLQIPIEISVKLGAVAGPPGITAAPQTSQMVTPHIAPPSSPANQSFGDALAAARIALAGVPNVIAVRLGYRFKRGWITNEQVIVVEVRDKMPLPDLNRAGLPLIPNQFHNVGVDVRTAGFVDQLGNLGIGLGDLEARARPAGYREPPADEVSLELVKEPMRAIFHVSPDSGFPNLKAFIGRVKQFLVATIYEWDPTHISDAIETAMTPHGRSLKMVTQPKFGIAAGTEDAVDDMTHRIGSKFQHVYASVGSGKLIPSDYHIKVASRDGEEFWLSSGNWKDSNQANIDPAGDHSTSIAPLRDHNREWHAIIANARLATIFQKYIEWDFQEAQRVPFEESVPVAGPDLFIPEAAFLEGLEAPVAVQYFDPLVIDRELEVQPLLTPDRDSRGNRIFMEFATDMIRKASRSIYIENQSFNLLANDNNVDEFEQFFVTLRDQQASGVDVKVIFRDPREFPRGAKKLSDLLELLKTFGLDTDTIKVQRKCHTKGIIVDTSEVLLGSHNLTNVGSLYNRDASLLVRDPDVAAYFEKVFLFDWNNMATQNADELVGGMRLAMPGEATPVGFRRVPLTELLSETS